MSSPNKYADIAYVKMNFEEAFDPLIIEAMKPQPICCIICGKWKCEHRVYTPSIDDEELTINDIMDRIANKQCPKCGIDLELVENETHVYKYKCKCLPHHVAYG